MDAERLIQAMERLVRTPVSPHHVIGRTVDLRSLRRYVRKVRDHHEAGRAALRSQGEG